MVPTHDRLTFLGVFGPVASPLERWSFGLNLGRPSGPTTTQERLDLVNDCVQQWRLMMAPIYRAGVLLAEVKHAEIGDDGKYMSDAVLSTDAAQPGHVDPVTYRYPPQVAIVASLSTNARGAKGRGRCFLPAPHYALEEDLTITVEGQQAVRNGMAHIIQTINDRAVFGNVVVASNSGALFPVTGVRVGQVLDTMRSRRRDLSEDYSPTTAIVPR